MFQHSRQHIATRGTASAATARKLIATSQQPAPHIIAATVECNDYTEAVCVVACRSKSDQIKCGVSLRAGQVYYMVRSRKFQNRWYVYTKAVCSSRDMHGYCASQVEAFKARLVAA